jgi:dolichyl-phosphate beta-glucosyltransferase
VLEQLDLSVVIPAFNEEARLPPSLRRLLAHLEARTLPFEVVVVDDGSTDDTAARVAEMGHPAVRITRNERNRGKGYSVRRGMLLARGARRLMTDADLSTPIEDLAALLERLEGGADVVIGSRAARGSQVLLHQPWYRENVGRLFNLLARFLAVPGFGDTQCGFKLFSARAAELIFARTRLEGFSFDVEALVVAVHLGLVVAEVPVTWRNDTASRVTWRKGAQAFLDLLRIRANAWRGRYDQNPAGSSTT